jgi:hypothetical protein
MTEEFQCFVERLVDGKIVMVEEDDPKILEKVKQALKWREENPEEWKQREQDRKQNTRYITKVTTYENGIPKGL